METIPERYALNMAGQQILKLTGLPEAKATFETLAGNLKPDLVLEVGRYRFAIEWKRNGSAALIAGAIGQLKTYAKQLGDNAIPIVAVPFMGDVGKQRCEEAGVSWLDLSGNASIHGDGLHIRVDGNFNAFKGPGRPASLFAPKSSRIARWLLIHPGTFISQRELSEETDLDEGYTSKIVRRLEEQELLSRNEAGEIRPSDPDLLLDSWREAYHFSKHTLIQGHMPVRSGEEALKKISAELIANEIPHAFTGLPAAWLVDPFSNFRLTTCYLGELPAQEFFSQINFRNDSKGANVWLVLPNDEGVFDGRRKKNGYYIVHPVQIYLDLLAQPERASEAASSFRRNILKWDDRDN